MINRVLDRLEEFIVASFMAAATIVVFLAVVHRYTASVPWIWEITQHLNVTWAQELCIYLFIWMAKFGAAYGVRTGIHVGVDVLVRTLAPKAQRFWTLFGLASGAAFTSTVVVLGAMFVVRVHGTGQVSPDLEMPMWIIYLAVPLGSTLMCYRFLQVAVSFWHTGALPQHDPTGMGSVQAGMATPPEGAR